MVSCRPKVCPRSVRERKVYHDTRFLCACVNIIICTAVSTLLVHFLCTFVLIYGLYVCVKHTMPAIVHIAFDACAERASIMIYLSLSHRSWTHFQCWHSSAFLLHVYILKGYSLESL